MMDNTEQAPPNQQQQKQTGSQDDTILLFGIFKSKFHAAKIHEIFKSLCKALRKKGFNAASCQ